MPNPRASIELAKLRAKRAIRINEIKKRLQHLANDAMNDGDERLAETIELLTELIAKL